MRSNEWSPVSSKGKRAAFLDRDGTIMMERDYVADPDRVELINGAIEALQELSAAGYELIIVTNQSGIARGILTERDFRAVQERLETVLAEHGVRFTGVYFCPHHPDFTGPCDCRKPGPALYEQAAREHGLDLAQSVYIGDRVRDVEAAVGFKGLGILVRTGYGAGEADRTPDGVQSADDLLSAARVALHWRAGQ